MIRHEELGNWEVRALIRQGGICFAGNRKLRIFGRLDCSRGKRMRRQNRVFFSSAASAAAAGYRPCGHCMKFAYQKWKNGAI
ncbi:Ada metal-binding domain-containing protein [Pedobacter sp. SYP-B3415]|uniref:Ada metal-binding domain-containing protein n=1 Tax=Pedobacter sp. SYP-B3415 TaxID=2496641 RepID=UPI00101D8EB0|nr:Ada metal-binding domain-containing protein [Pedobacter sp. SYP-B3415]